MFTDVTLVNYDTLNLHALLFDLGVGSGLHRDLPALADLRRVVNFSVCLALCLLLLRVWLLCSLHDEPETESSYNLSF